MTECNRGVVGVEGDSLLHHVALVVSSLSRSANFYCTLLGLHTLHHVRLSNHTIQYLSSGTKAVIELIEYDPGICSDYTEKGISISLGHMAWKVQDIEKVAALSSELGGTVTATPHAVPELNCISALVRDLDGIEFELVQTR